MPSAPPHHLLGVAGFAVEQILLRFEIDGCNLVLGVEPILPVLHLLLGRAETSEHLRRTLILFGSRILFEFPPLRIELRRLRGSDLTGLLIRRLANRGDLRFRCFYFHCLFEQLVPGEIDLPDGIELCFIALLLKLGSLAAKLLELGLEASNSGLLVCSICPFKRGLLANSALRRRDGHGDQAGGRVVQLDAGHLKRGDTVRVRQLHHVEAHLLDRHRESVVGVARERDGRGSTIWAPRIGGCAAASST
jgi:hypothetical protein